MGTIIEPKTEPTPVSITIPSPIESIEPKKKPSPYSRKGTYRTSKKRRVFPSKKKRPGKKKTLRKRKYSIDREKPYKSSKMNQDVITALEGYLKDRMPLTQALLMVDVSYPTYRNFCSSHPKQSARFEYCKDFLKNQCYKSLSKITNPDGYFTFTRGKLIQDEVTKKYKIVPDPNSPIEHIEVDGKAVIDTLKHIDPEFKQNMDLNVKDETSIHLKAIEKIQEIYNQQRSLGINEPNVVDVFFKVKERETMEQIAQTTSEQSEVEPVKKS